MATGKPNGRAPAYTSEIGLTICERLADGESLRAICSDSGMPDKATVLSWLDSQPAFRDRYALARQMQIEDLVDENIEIADREHREWLEGLIEPQQARHHLARTKFRLEVRHWVLDRLAAAADQLRMKETAK
jgi:Bacteriophage Sf6, terminase small subunit-like